MAAHIHYAATYNSQTSDISDMPKGRPLNKRDKEKIREQHRLQLEEEKVQKQRDKARQEIARLKETGIVEAYESFLRSICKYGLPEPRNVYEMAAQHVLRHHKKIKQKQQKKSLIMEYNSSVMNSNSQKQERRSPSPIKSKR